MSVASLRDRFSSLVSSPDFSLMVIPEGYVAEYELSDEGHILEVEVTDDEAYPLDLRLYEPHDECGRTSAILTTLSPPKECYTPGAGARSLKYETIAGGLVGEQARETVGAVLSEFADWWQSGDYIVVNAAVDDLIRHTESAELISEQGRGRVLVRFREGDGNRGGSGDIRELEIGYEAWTEPGRNFQTPVGFAHLRDAREECRRQLKFIWTVMATFDSVEINREVGGNE